MNPRRALVLAPRLPEFDRESGSRRTLTIIEMLLEEGYSVTFGSAHLTRSDRYVRMLEQMGVETYAPVKRLDEIPNLSYDIAILAFWHMAEEHLRALREMSPSTRIVIDTIDLHFVREARGHLGDLTAGAGPGQLGRDYANDFVRELNTYAAADAILTVSQKEADLINDLFNDHSFAYCVPDCEELERSTVPFRDRRGVVFIGNFRHAPNRDAASYLCREIVPRLDETLLDQHEILIVGNEPDNEIKEIASETPHVRLVGWVPSVLPYLERARASVIPLRYGAGTKRKLIQALMIGTPTVSSSVGAEGLGLRDGEHVLVADDPASFAASIERLLSERSLWKRLARRGRKHVGVSHGREAVKSRLVSALDAVRARAARPVVSELNRELRGSIRTPEYERLVTRVREVIESELPEGSTVLIAGKGDDDFLKVEGRVAWHFPMEDGGTYAGHHPADSEEAIAHLEKLRSRGAQYLVLPNTAFWWLAFYREFQTHLDSNYRRFWNGNYMIMYDLEGQGAAERAPETKVADPKLVVTTPSPNGGRSADGGKGTNEDVVVTPELIERLRPSIAESITTRWSGSDRKRRALLVGVYMADKPNTIRDMVQTLLDTKEVDLHQRWVALGGTPPSGDVAAVTSRVVPERAPKYRLLNQLLEEEDLEQYDFVLTADDDVVLPHGFLDTLLGIQSELDFSIAQPARTSGSYVDHPIVIQQRGVLARETLFVEIGPILSLHRSAFSVVLPFDTENEMGWGFENTWSYELARQEKKMGIIDAVPVDHSIRAPVAHYSWDSAVAQREAYLSRRPHLPLADCFRVLDVVGMDR